MHSEAVQCMKDSAGQPAHRAVVQLMYQSSSSPHHQQWFQGSVQVTEATRQAGAHQAKVPTSCRLDRYSLCRMRAMPAVQHASGKHRALQIL